MKLLKGKGIAEKILAEVKKDVKNRRIKPGLAVVLVGNNPASEIYVKLKAKAAKQVNIRFKLVRFKADTSENKIVSAIKKLNADKRINGIIVQLPLPQKFNKRKVISAIDPRKDVDGFHPINLKKFLAGKISVYPVFPLAIMKLLEASKVKLSDKKAVIIANSKEFGLVMRQALKLRRIKAKYIFSKNLEKNFDLLKGSDIVVTAMGKPGLIRGNMLKKDAVVIDGGINKTGKRVLGDGDFESVKSVASCLSPVPGGVGPVTIACLLKNVSNMARNI